MNKNEWFERIQDIDIHEICESFDIQIYPNDFISCLFHNDRSPTNCHLHNNKFKCFACGESGDGIKLIRQKYGISTMEAAKKISKAFGIAGYDDNSGCDDTFPFRSSDLSYIGLATNAFRAPSGNGDISVTLTDPKNGLLYTEPLQEIKRDHDRLFCFMQSYPTFQYAALEEGDVEGYVSFDTQQVSIQSLYRDDKECFWEMIAGKMSEKIPIYLQAYEAEVWNNRNLFPATSAPDIKNALEAILKTVRGMNDIVWTKNRDVAKKYGLIFNWPVFKKDIARYSLEL